MNYRKENSRLRLLAILGIATSFVLNAFGFAGAKQVEFFAAADVKLLGGPLLDAMKLNREHLLKYDPDRLLVPFLVEAGLPPKASPYGNWENTGLDGHTAGHYLSALAYTAVALSDETCRRRLDYMVDQLVRCQQASGNGYVGGIPRGKELWSQVAAGDIRATGFGLNDRWVPWYNLHKTFQGLRDAWLIAGNAKAREAFIRLCDWCVDLVSHLEDTQLQQMLASEHGGMNEVLADATALTGDDEYLQVAKRFSHRVLLDPLRRQEDRLNGMHANTQVPKVIGFEQIAQLSGDPGFHTAAEFFWNTVTSTRTLVFGGNSISEHFPAPHQSAQWMQSREGPETCNTYNMLRLSQKLFQTDQSPRYVDFVERAIFNHILSSQHPQHGGYVYFTSVRPRHYRTYSQPEQAFWCCVGTGMENHAKYGEFVYARDQHNLYVNLFVPSRLMWKDRGVVLTQETTFPEGSSSILKFDLDRPVEFSLQVRHPEWATRDFQIRVNGQTLDLGSSPGSYAKIQREWHSGDRVEISMPMEIRSESLPNLDRYIALLYGPLVLAAPTTGEPLDGLLAGAERMDHVARGSLEPVDASSMLIGNLEEVLAAVKKTHVDSLTFVLPGEVRGDGFGDAELMPFYRVHDTRYTMYWQLLSRQQYKAEAQREEQEELARIALDRRTLDRVVPGQQQPESDHNFQGQRTSTGRWQDRPFRHAEGWFSYELDAGDQRDLALQITYFGSDQRQFSIFVNDRLLQEVDLRAPQPNEFIDVRYPIPEELLAGLPASKVTVKFVASEGSMAGGIYDVRLLNASAE